LKTSHSARAWRISVAHAFLSRAKRIDIRREADLSLSIRFAQKARRFGASHQLEAKQTPPRCFRFPSFRKAVVVIGTACPAVLI
jgi:hypothetical protein